MEMVPGRVEPTDLQLVVDHSEQEGVFGGDVDVPARRSLDVDTAEAEGELEVIGRRRGRRRPSRGWRAELFHVRC